MVAAVQKSHKTVSFDPFAAAAAERVAGISGPGLLLIRDSRSGGGDLSNKVLQAMTTSLLGKGLDKMNKTMVLGMMPLMDALIANAPDPIDLHGWCREIITIASTEAIWGSKNPFKSEKIARDFWYVLQSSSNSPLLIRSYRYFETHLSILLANVLPSITARKAYFARESVVQAMLEYANSGGFEEQDCSDLALSQWQTQKSLGATDINIARIETAFNLGVLSNTVPSAFWSIFDICSRPELLNAVREELEQNAIVVDPETNVHCIDLGRMRSVCPIFVSSFQETLRVHSTSAPTRMVYEDVMLDNTYLLKAGSVVQISGPGVNSETAVWGQDAKEYDITHFLSERRDGAKGSFKPKPRPTSFMSFGASPNLCPGRHFAAAEVLSLVAMLLLRADVKPSKGQWWTPRLNAWAVAATVSPPAEAYPVSVHAREKYKGVKWSFVVEGEKDRFDLVVG